MTPWPFKVSLYGMLEGPTPLVVRSWVNAYKYCRRLALDPVLTLAGWSQVHRDRHTVGSGPGNPRVKNTRGTLAPQREP